MKNLLIVILAAFLLSEATGAERLPSKQFASGFCCLGYYWDACHEGDHLNYVVFAYNNRPRAVGESRIERYVKVVNPSSRHPRATLYLGPKSERDLFRSDVQIYQVEKDGVVRPHDGKVTYSEFRTFVLSAPKEYTAEALLAFVHGVRMAQQ